MTERTESQILGSQGESLVAHIINSTGCWIPRIQQEDFGIDIEAELSSPHISGQILKIQVKASRFIEATGMAVACLIPRKLAIYADSCRLPVILVRVDLEKKEAWYLWMQQWLLDMRRSGHVVLDLPEMTSHKIPVTETLRAGLNGKLRKIAQWETNTQLVLTVNDAIRTAASVYDYKVLNHLVALLDNVGIVNDDFPINLVIEQALSLGPDLWGTHPGNQASSTLYAICRHFGRNFSGDQIRRMVTRGESCSRTGINALGILYDQFFDHIATLNLVSLFLGHADQRVAFYCHLREQFPKASFFECLDRASNAEFAGLTIDPRLQEDVMGKWPNRGDSVILDYLTIREADQEKRLR